MVDTSDAWIVKRTGIRERRIASPDETTSDMAAAAGRRALAAAGLEAEALDALILATMSPDAPTPATACAVQTRLGARDAAAFDLNAACTGFIYAAAAGAAFIRSGMFRHVLVIGSDCNSRIINWSDRNTCVLFGDGAGAAVFSGHDDGAGADILDCELGCDGACADYIRVPAGGTGMPATHATVDGGLHFLTMNGREVFKFAVTSMVAMLTNAAKRNGLTPGALDLIIPHQVNYRIIAACADRLAIPMTRFVINIERYGNTSAASIPIALDEAVALGRLQRGDTVCLLGFGAGMTWGYTLLRW